ncbi:MAG: phosphorylase [Acidobacteriota bacterium]|nr:phosphorylase [Acidobacteriota bacterium]
MSRRSLDFALVAALEREVRGIVRGWRRRMVEGLPLYESENAVVICAGTGARRARQASQALLEKYTPKLLISIGYAGSCDASTVPGSVLVPARVVDSATGQQMKTAFGCGCLVTLDKVAGSGLKQCSAARYSAQAVDMEAFGVAEAAESSGAEFLAIKAVSDGAEEDLDFLGPFIRPDGFAIAPFLVHIMFRPALWPKVAQLQRGSKLASQALTEAVNFCLKDCPSFAEQNRENASRHIKGE